MKIKIPISLYLLLFFISIGRAADNSISLEKISDELTVKLLATGEFHDYTETLKKESDEYGLKAISIRLIATSGLGSCPGYLSEKYEGGCSKKYYLAASIGEMPRYDFVYYLGDFGEVVKVESTQSKNTDSVGLRLTIQNYPSWVFLQVKEGIIKSNKTINLQVSEEGVTQLK